jgi:hypothetical protein
MREACSCRRAPGERLYARDATVGTRYAGRRVAYALRFRVLLLEVEPIVRGVYGVACARGMH